MNDTQLIIGYWLVVIGLSIYGYVIVILKNRVTNLERKLEEMAKDNSGKAPLSGNNSTQKRDDKATATGSPYPPNRPHTDKGK